MPSVNKDEREMNISSDRKTIDEQIALVGKGGNYLSLPFDIDKAAQIVEPDGKGLVLGVRFGPGEWNREVPIVKDLKPCSGHAVTITNATMYKGKKALVIEDSWGIDSGIQGRRIVTQDWFDKGRVIGLLYFQFLKNTWRDEGLPAPVPDLKHDFKINLSYGLTSLEVIWLQRILKHEELFPQNVDCTGFYGNITAKAVLSFQLKYKVDNEQHLNYLNGRNVGPKTRGKLNELYA